MGGQGHGKVAGLGVDVAREGSFAPPVLGERAPGCSLRPPRRPVAIVPGVLHGFGDDVYLLRQERDVELLFSRSRKEVGLGPAERVRAGLCRDSSRGDRKLLKLCLDHGGDPRQHIFWLGIEEEASRPGMERPGRVRHACWSLPPENRDPVCPTRTVSAVHWHTDTGSIRQWGANLYWKGSADATPGSSAMNSPVSGSNCQPPTSTLWSPNPASTPSSSPNATLGKKRDPPQYNTAMMNPNTRLVRLHQCTHRHRMQAGKMPLPVPECSEHDISCFRRRRRRPDSAARAMNR